MDLELQRERLLRELSQFQSELDRTNTEPERTLVQASIKGTEMMLSVLNKKLKNLHDPEHRNEFKRHSID